MNSRDQLAALYDQWRSMTLREGAAMRQGDWVAVDRVQREKTSLQSEITAALDRLEGESSPRVVEGEFRSVVDDLIRLEKENLALLASRREQWAAELKSLDQSGRNLRLIHRCYSQPQKSAHWQSFS